MRYKNHRKVEIDSLIEMKRVAEAHGLVVVINNSIIYHRKIVSERRLRKIRKPKK